MSLLSQSIEMLEHVESREISGSVASVRGLTLLVDDLPLPIGAQVRIEAEAAALTTARRVARPEAGAEQILGAAGRATPRLSPGHPTTPRATPSLPVAERSQGASGTPVRGQVVGFEGGRSVVMLYDSSDGIRAGLRVASEQSSQIVMVGQSMLGRVIDGLGQPIDEGSRLLDVCPRFLNPPPISALARKRIHEPLPTGLRAVDGLVTLGKGQRIGIFSGPGVGKSTLLASIARNTTADINVIALLGERGREVREFMETSLGDEGLSRSVMVVSTSDESPVLRVRSAMLACTVAEYFREQGADVMLMMDSLTRLAQAQRQVGLATGEQPATRGYTPSVFALMPKLLERAGALAGGGSITGLYTVLVEGDDLNEPISDAARGILDGHIALSRRLASRGHYPAVDLLESISRVADEVTDGHHAAARRRVRRLLASYAEAEELINIGAYARGSNRETDLAIEMKGSLDRFLQQDVSEPAVYAQTCRRLIELALHVEELEKAHGKK